MLEHVVGASKIKIYAQVKKADGRVYNLGRIDGPFPWRAWLYRLRFNLDKLLNKFKKGN
jgi:hypothetical protein